MQGTLRDDIITIGTTKLIQGQHVMYTRFEGTKNDFQVWCYQDSFFVRYIKKDGAQVTVKDMN